jgi:hypothetical protein
MPKAPGDRPTRLWYTAVVAEVMSCGGWSIPSMHNAWCSIVIIAGNAIGLGSSNGSPLQSFGFLGTVCLWTLHHLT